MKPYTKKEETYLRANYGKLSAFIMGVELKRSVQSIHNKVSYMGLTKRKKSVKTTYVLNISLTDKPLKDIVKVISVLQANKIDFSY